MEIRGVDPIRGITQDSKINKIPRRDERDTSDEVEISEEARQLAEAAKIEDVVRQSPDIREDRVAEVKAKLERGEYNTQEVFDQVAERIMKALGL
ncbi:flagellar biosynthesis anti-sigma factor FlgM [Thermospira aquatica]|uniref:Flagellar biosynthesis anti-sigma factor FlgM n=1 Tax=Thermospira aquatica TaxID=2828656 RepID=A0AAX3BE91_9SPIR|nr:flagellar biosynthesis anti-sigma factor FlgM [Thermospira aquatica]URA10657.1 flagellar biosynthesis anti-sigma factor FlgM [Thermospira aquatica]